MRKSRMYEEALKGVALTALRQLNEQAKMPDDTTEDAQVLNHRTQGVMMALAVMASVRTRGLDGLEASRNPDTASADVMLKTMAANSSPLLLEFL